MLLSSIIKAENVFFDDSSNKKQVKKTAPKLVDSSKEDIYEIYNQREVILTEANEEAEKIIKTAKRNAQSEIIEQKNRGYEEGFNAGLEIGKSKGYEEGYNLGKEEVSIELNNINKSKINEINSMIESIEREKQNIISKYEDKLEKISIEIAEKIIREKIELQENVISKIVEDVIKDYKNVEWIKVYVSSEDEGKNIEADKFIIKELKKISKDVKIEASKELSEGSCIVETPDNIVDASIDTQLNNLKDLILNKQEI